MRTRHFVSFILITAGHCLCAHATDTIATFSSLPTSDSLEIRFTSRGCFHFYTYDFVFRHASVSVASVTQQWSKKKQQYIETSREMLGQVQLTDADIKRLDELLRFYRSQRDNGCTTVDTITFSQLRDGKTIATEQFVDGSCSIDTTNSFATLPEIARRLEKKK